MYWLMVQLGYGTGLQNYPQQNVKKKFMISYLKGTQKIIMSVCRWGGKPDVWRTGRETSRCFNEIKLCTAWIYTKVLYQSFKNINSFFKKAPNLDNKLPSELLILSIQGVPLFHFLPKNRLGAMSQFHLIKERQVCWPERQGCALRTLGCMILPRGLWSASTQRTHTMHSTGSALCALQLFRRCVWEVGGSGGL